MLTEGEADPRTKPFCHLVFIQQNWSGIICSSNELYIYLRRVYATTFKSGQNPFSLPLSSSLLACITPQWAVIDKLSLLPFKALLPLVCNRLNVHIVYILALSYFPTSHATAHLSFVMQAPIIDEPRIDTQSVPIKQP